MYNGPVRRRRAGHRPAIRPMPDTDISIKLLLYIIYLQERDHRAIMPISVYNMYTKFKKIEFSLISYRITIQILE